MSKVTFDLKIPESLQDIPLGKYQEYAKVLDANKDVEDAGEFLNKKALQIFCGVDLKDTFNLPLSTFMFALQHLENIMKESTPLVRNFKFRDPNGIEQTMGFIPNLEKMTFGEYVDLDGYIGDWATMHKAMAVLYRPVRYASGEKYLIEEYNGTETYGEAMKEMPVAYAFGAMVFFYRLGNKLLNGTMKYLENQPELRKKLNDSLPADGAGIHHLLQSQTDLTLTLMEQQRFHSVKP